MKIKISFYLVLFAFAGMFLFSGCGKPSALVVTVNFGQQPKGGGACSGKGLCNSVAQTQANAASGITATMMVFPVAKNVIIMSFSMAELKQKQPEQVQYFTDGGSYNFDGAFDLSDQMYASLHLAPAARIDQNCKTKVDIKGDVIMLSITYTHS